MTLSEVITIVDGIKPNAFTEEDKTRWINEVEGNVQIDVFLLSPDDVKTYKWEDDKNCTLLVAPPHDKIYEAYLAAKIDYANGEYNKYQNTYQMYNAFFTEFAAWFAETYRPADFGYEIVEGK